MTSCNRSKFSSENQTWKRLISVPNFSSKARWLTGRWEQQEWSGKAEYLTHSTTQLLQQAADPFTKSYSRIPARVTGEKVGLFALDSPRVHSIPFHCLLWFSSQIFTLSLTLCLAVADVFLKAQGSLAALQWPLFKCLLLHTQISLRLSFPPKQCSSLHVTAESISISLLALLLHTSVFHPVISTSKFCAP